MLLSTKLIIFKVNYFILNDLTATWLMKKKRMQLFDDGRTTLDHRNFCGLPCTQR